VKKAAKEIGWDGKKDYRGRNFLSDLKDATTRYDDIPFKAIIKRWEIALDAGFKYFAVNIREPEEIQKFVDFCTKENIPCSTIRIINKAAEKEAVNLKNTGDSGYMNYEYDHCIENNSTLEKFRDNVNQFLEGIDR